MIFKHFILCRYNLGLFSDNPYSVSDPLTWMLHRLPKYQRLLKSLKEQSNQHFQFIVGIDSETPQNWKETIETVTGDYLSRSQFKVIQDIPQAWLNGQKITSDWIITSRIDNDDSYNREFVRTIQYYFTAKEQILDVKGVQIDELTGKRYTSGRFKPNSPFISFIERNEGYLKTVFHHTHSKVLEHHDCSFAGTERLSNQYIHERNVINKIRGVEL